MLRRRDAQLISHIDWNVFRGLSLVLIVFTSTTPFYFTHGYGPDLPRPKHAKRFPDALDDRARMLAITRDGLLYFGSDKVTHAGLISQLRRDPAAAPEKTLYIRADIRARYGLVMDIVDDARAAGIDRVAFLSEIREGTYLDACCVADQGR